MKVALLFGIFVLCGCVVSKKKNTNAKYDILLINDEEEKETAPQQ